MSESATISAVPSAVPAPTPVADGPGLSAGIDAGSLAFGDASARAMQSSASASASASSPNAATSAATQPSGDKGWLETVSKGAERMMDGVTSFFSDDEAREEMLDSAGESAASLNAVTSSLTIMALGLDERMPLGSTALGGAARNFLTSFQEEGSEAVYEIARETVSTVVELGQGAVALATDPEALETAARVGSSLLDQVDTYADAASEDWSKPFSDLWAWGNESASGVLDEMKMAYKGAKDEGKGEAGGAGAAGGVLVGAVFGTILSASPRGVARKAEDIVEEALDKGILYSSKTVSDDLSDLGAAFQHWDGAIDIAPSPELGFAPDLQRHVMGVDLDSPYSDSGRKRKLAGGHTTDAVEAAEAAGLVRITETRDLGGGFYAHSLQRPQKNAQGEVTGWVDILSPKTTFDTAIYPPERMMDMQVSAAELAYKQSAQDLMMGGRKQISVTTTFEGVDFSTTLRLGDNGGIYVSRSFPLGPAKD